MTDAHLFFPLMSSTDYAEISVLTHITHENLLSHLELMTLKPNVILNIGCGLETSTESLKNKYNNAEVITIDYAEKFLHSAREKFTTPYHLLFADTQISTLKENSVDFIFANLFLPWRNDWEKLFLECRRILRPEGLIIFSCLGLDTLKEFSQEKNSLLHLVDMHEVGDLLTKVKFSDPVLDVEYLTFNYQDPKKMLFELQVTGMLSLENNIDIQKLPSSITYEIIYGHAFGPSLLVDQVADENGIIRIPLHRLRKN